MTLITKVLVAVALIVITIEFITVFRVRAERKTWESFNNWGQ